MPPPLALRLVGSAAMTVWLTAVLAAGVAGLGAGLLPAFAIAAPFAIAAAYAIRRATDRVAASLLAGPRIWLVVMFAAAIVAAAWTARLTVFMIDSTRVNCSYVPSDPFRAFHNCFSSYAEGARFAVSSEPPVNIYDDQLYRPGGKPRTLGNLRADPYHYPPPFLLLPAAVRLAAPEFAATRAVWFMLQALTFGLALVLVARWIGGEPGAFAAAMTGLIVVSPPVMMTLQQGNFQLTAVAIAMSALVLLSRGRTLSGATLLAYAAVSKIFPGVLVLFLIGARRFRAAIAVSVMAAALVVLTIVSFGMKPMMDFIGYELPRIASGEAFPQTEYPGTMLMNLSVYGQTVRARRLLAAWFGVNWFSAETGRTIASIYGIVVLMLAAAAGWFARETRALIGGPNGSGSRSGSGSGDSHGLANASSAPEARLRLAQLALALLSLASFRSPFVGFVYGFIASAWLIALLAAEARTTARRLAWLGVFAVVTGAIALTPSPPVQGPIQPPTPPHLMAIQNVLFGGVLLLNLAIVARAIKGAWRTSDEAVLGAPLGVELGSGRADLSGGRSGL